MAVVVLTGSEVQAIPLNYVVSPRSTDISFAVDLLGLATVEGDFMRFSGHLTLDLDNAESSAVEVKIETASAIIGWEPAASMVTGESYLDVEHYPEILFSSSRVTRLGDGKVRLEGLLTLRGVSHWEAFDAELTGRRWNADQTGEIAEFTATGTVHRSDYHMGVDQSFLDDRVIFTIRSRLLLNSQTALPAPTP